MTTRHHIKPSPYVKRETTFHEDNWPKRDNEYTNYRLDKPTDSGTLNGLYQKEGGLWLNEKSQYMFRFSPDGEILENVPQKVLVTILEDVLMRSVRITDEMGSSIDNRMLRVVSETVYNPHINKEFYQENGKNIRNLFHIKGSYLNMLTERYYDPSEVIIKLFSFLTNDDEKAIKYLMNDLAYYFQTLKAPSAHWVFLGTHTEGMEILVDHILKPLFGQSNFIRIHDEELNEDFIERTKNNLIVNIDKMPIEGVDRKSLGKQMQQLLKEKSDYTFVIFTTSETQDIGIERDKEGFSMFGVQQDITDTDYLGYGNYNKLIKALQGQLYDFAEYLYGVDVNLELLSNAYSTPQKDELIARSSNRIERFIEALKKKDLDYFNGFKNTSNARLHEELQEGFYKNVVSKIGLTTYFNALEKENFSAKGFMVKLRAVDKNFFTESKNAKGTDSGDDLFMLNSKYNECYVPETGDSDPE